MGTSADPHGDEVMSGEEAQQALELGPLRGATLVGRHVLEPAKDADGNVVGLTRQSVVAEKERRAKRGPLGTAWDGFKSVLRWLP